MPEDRPTSPLWVSVEPEVVRPENWAAAPGHPALLDPQLPSTPWKVGATCKLGTAHTSLSPGSLEGPEWLREPGCPQTCSPPPPPAHTPPKSQIPAKGQGAGRAGSPAMGLGISARKGRADTHSGKTALRPTEDSPQAADATAPAARRGHGPPPTAAQPPPAALGPLPFASPEKGRHCGDRLQRPVTEPALVPWAVLVQPWDLQDVTLPPS